MIVRRLFAALLRLYPAAARAEARAEMLPLFVELDLDARRRGIAARFVFVCRAFVDVVQRAFEAHRTPIGASAPRSRPTASDPPPGRNSAMLDRFWQELRVTLRGLRRNPGFVAVVVFTLAIGIGANAAIFSIIKGVLLDELPYDEPERVVGIWQYDLDSGDRARVTPGNFLDIRALDVFAAVAAFGFSSATLLAGDEPETLRGGRVSADYLETLGVRPRLGRGFRADDEDPGGPEVVIISEELWARRFDSDAQIIGDTINLDGMLYEVVGVLPSGIYPTFATVGGNIPFTPDNHDFLVPLRFSADFYSTRRSHILGAVGRLADGVSVQQADDAVDALAASLAAQYPLVAGEGFTLSLLRDEIVGGTRPALLVLMGTVAVVLLIAATNVAGILLARADARASETAVRAALGAGRGDLVRQSLIESSLLTGLGAVVGLTLAVYGIDAIKRLVPYQIPRMNEVGLDLPVLGFTCAVAVAVGIVLGVAPALLTRQELLSRLRQGATGLTGDGRQRRAQGILVSAQTCMAIILVVGAGLLLRTFVQIQRIDPGFSGDAALTVPLTLPSTRYPSNDEVTLFYQQLEASLTAMPGVASVAFAYDHPLAKSWTDSFLLEGDVPGGDNPSGGASFRPVSPGYFETVGVPLLAGRAFQRTDLPERTLVAVVNDAFASRYFPSDDPVGRRMRIPTIERMFGDGTELWLEIVGLVGDVRFNGPTAPVEPAMYISLTQVPMSGFSLIVAPQRPGVDLAAATRSAIRDIDPELPITHARSLDSILSEATDGQRFNMLLVGSFALLALALAGLGIYGLIARLVQSQVKEIGIRVTLGSPPGRIVELVLAGALRPVLAGGALGLIGAVALSRLLQSLLYEVDTLDPATFLLTPLVLVATALLAAWLPARRAMAIDPIEALRHA